MHRALPSPFLFLDEEDFDSKTQRDKKTIPAR
jgi:hypothetical protein